MATTIGPSHAIERDLESVRELAQRLGESQDALRQAQEAIGAHKPGPVGKPDTVYQELSARSRDANADVLRDRAEIRLVLGWIAWELGV